MGRLASVFKHRGEGIDVGSMKGLRSSADVDVSGIAVPFIGRSSYASGSREGRAVWATSSGFSPVDWSLYGHWSTCSVQASFGFSLVRRILEPEGPA